MSSSSIFSRLLPCHIAVSILAAVALLVSHTTACAAPMTYAFQATVGPLPPGNGDVSLPFTLQEGSVIDGLITIDSDLSQPPLGNSSKSEQPHAIELSFDGFTFGSEQYEATAINDSGIVDGPNAGPADFVNFSCSATSLDVDCNSHQLQFPGSPPLELSMTGSFAGNIALLSEPTLPSDAETWNGFSIFRDFTFRFIDRNANVGDSYFTSLGSFSLVPEPSSILISAMCVFQLAIFANRGSRIQ